MCYIHYFTMTKCKPSFLYVMRYLRSISFANKLHMQVTLQQKINSFISCLLVTQNRKIEKLINHSLPSSDVTFLPYYLWVYDFLEEIHACKILLFFMSKVCIIWSYFTLPNVLLNCFKEIFYAWNSSLKKPINQGIDKWHILQTKRHVVCAQIKRIIASRLV